MAAKLFTPILNDRTRSIHFFNGRLLTGEDMTAEQRGQRATHELIAQSIGDGIVRGLEVTIDDATSLAAPVVNVTGGVAINRKGETLYLPENTRVQLVRTADAAPAARTLFTACTPPESGVYVAGAGVYLLTLCSTVAVDGSASVSGLGGQPSGCNSRFAVDAVQFRLIELPMTDAEMSDIPRLRNLVAYRCFGVSSSFATDPFGATTEPPTLLDELRPQSLTDCDVPLATFYWTATGGLVWADMWSVRRRVAQLAEHELLATDFAKLNTRADAAVQQFQQQLREIAATQGPAAAVATDTFRYLPPFGLLPLKSTATETGFDYRTFFRGRTYREPLFVNAAKMRPMVSNSLLTTPIDLGLNEMLWLYQIVQNARARNPAVAGGTQQYLLFASGQIPYQADAQFNVSYWNYSNYSSCGDAAKGR